MQAAFIIALLVVPVFLLIISTQTTDELNYLDNFWYLNRARLIWQGILPDLFVYTLTYPSLVGLVNLFVADVLLAGMLTNAFLLWCILLGVYLLGCWLYKDRRVAWLAVTLVLVNASLLDALRLFWATVSFTAATVWCLVAAVLVTRQPRFGTAVLLGAVLALAVYTRVEGVTYGLFVPATAWLIFKQQGYRAALRALITTSVVFAVLCLPFALNFLYIRNNINAELSTAVTGVFTLLDRTPVEWPVIWRRLTDTLTGLLSHWSTLAWLVGIAGLLWSTPRYRTAQWICAALIVLNLLYSFLLSIWPYPIHVIFYLPLFGLILASTLIQLAERARWSRRLAVVLLIVLLVPNLLHAGRRAVEVPVMAYRTSASAATGAALDGWLVEQGWYEQPIYTFCDSILSFSHARLQLIYRLQFATGWDTPEQLLPRLRAENALLMVCGNQVYFPDWRPLLQQATPSGLVEAGRFENFVFYRPDEAN